MKALKGREVLSTYLIQNIVASLILLALSFFFSGSETALFSLPRVVADRLKQTSPSGRRVAELLDKPNRLLVTILLGNLAVNILFSEIIGVWAFKLFGSFPYSDYIASLAAILFTTIVLLLFAEIVPKTIAINNAERFALGITIPLKAFSTAAYPLIRVILLLTDSILRLVGVQKGETDSVVTEDELKTLIAMSEEEGVLESQERLMIHRIIEFGDTLVRDVFIPRTDMVSVKHDISIAQLIETMKENKAKGKKSGIIVAAEGVGDNRRLAKEIEKTTGSEVRLSVLGYAQRGGSPTARSRILASLFANKAVELLSKGQGNRFVGLKNGNIVSLELKKAYKNKKPLDLNILKLARILAR